MDHRAIPAQRLAALELQGYKSFATKTRFEFAPTITAVVGPNGSGKSNIADAIRWVLGEQSYSLLRGRKTEDMIFNGSETRPRAGMASATITFDNSDGWLPIEFSEVTVARRAYRDGQNEYILNGQKVRLRDVEELLAESGLAQRTYTIIGQGLVDAVLALKAEDRRKIFEEAAGIGLHRSRREEAVRRLQATMRNLERVADILAELRPRLRSLERQAKHAEAYHQVRRDLLEAMRIWYGYHWYQGQEALREAEGKARLAQTARDTILVSQGSHSRELVEARQRATLLRQEIRDLERTIAAARGAKENAARELAVIEAREKWLVEQESLLQEEIRSSQTSQVEAEAQLRAAVAEETRIQQRIQSLQQMGMSVNGPVKQGLETAIDFRDKLQQEAAAKAAYEGERARFQRLQQELAALESERAQKLQRLEMAQTKLTELESMAREAENREVKLASKVHELRGDFDRMTKASAEARARRYEVLDLISQKRARLDTLLGVRQFFERGAQELLQAMRSGAFSGYEDRISDLIQVPERYQRAVAAALGAAFSGLIVEDRLELERALGQLVSEEESFPFALVVSAGARPPAPLSLPQDTGCIGLASDPVTAAEPVMQVVTGLLGRTLLVENREAVGRILADVPPDVRLVTLAGEVHYPSGLVELPGQAALSVMDHADAIEQAESQIQQAGLEAEELTRAVEASADKERELRTAIEDESAALDQARQIRSGADQALLTARLEARGLEGELVWLEGRASELNFQMESCQAAVDSLLASLPTHAAQIRPADLGHMDADLLLAELDGAGEMTALQAGLDRIKERVEAHARRAEQLKAELESRTARMEANQAERASLLVQAETLTNQLQQSESQLQYLVEQQREIEDRLTDSLDRRSRLEAEESTGLVELHHAEQRNTEFQIALAKIREEMLNLERRIIDDFGLVTFDEEDASMMQAPLPLDGLVQHLDRVHTLPPEHELQVNRLRSQLRRMGAVNPEAQQEFQQVRDRVDFLEAQTEDLEKAEKKLHRIVEELDALMAQEFEKTFEAVTLEFRKAFQRLFQGGSASLVLQQGEDLSTTGIDIEVRLPGRREQGLAMLSGGERSLTATALIFALLKVSPTPFCVLDEVDAMLDESNVLRFGEMLQELSAETQFCVITHNRLTIQHADVIYGVSIGADSASKVISLKLDEVEKELLG